MPDPGHIYCTDPALPYCTDPTPLLFSGISLISLGAPIFGFDPNPLS
jgi:hypothetical protein